MTSIDNSRLSTALSVQAKPAQGPTEFLLFPYLPVELQMQVWEAAPVVRRTFRITLIGLDRITDDGHKEPHVLLHVCRLSRHIAMKQMVRTKRLIHLAAFGGVSQDYLKPCYIDPRNDVFELWCFGPQARDLLVPATPDDAQEAAYWLPRALRHSNIDTAVIKTLLIHVHIAWGQFEQDAEEWSNSWPRKIRQVFPNIERMIFLSSSDSMWARLGRMPVAEKISQEMSAMVDEMNGIDTSPKKLELLDSVLVKHPNSTLRLYKIGEGAYFAESDNYHYFRKMEL
ncbi:hypothetical protein QBC37DRAFT_377023 [Rhypophila decipiens]|uniref:2EXR domain-containing protein n=1 Tax=Rhypophila decipiens TaxID=261697 RepID=A0AAN6Y1E8_9PEZI|nr:hypothetical protein QBC37DRAFT_377023 [Rhypophila decipiens]